MAEEEKDNKKEATEEAPKSNKKKTIIFLVVGIVLLLVAIAVPSTLLLMKNKEKAAEKLAADAALKENLEMEGWDDEEDELDEGEEVIGAIVPLQTFVVNLADDVSYLRAQIQLEFVTQEVPKRYYPRSVIIRDGLIKILAEHKPSELSSSTGKEQLKQEIRDFVNETMKKQEVKNVYFTQFVMQ